jgi:hypothetical protein
MFWTDSFGLAVVAGAGIGARRREYRVASFVAEVVFRIVGVSDWVSSAMPWRSILFGGLEVFDVYDILPGVILGRKESRLIVWCDCEGFRRFVG